jgi:uncharacterized surface protein with fasciclin (FAS1) repeats
MKINVKTLKLVLVTVFSTWFSVTAFAGAHSGAPMQKDIVDTAVAAGSFETLAAALQAAGLIDALKGDGPFTVFAPTDEAFAKLPEGTVDNLLKPENQEALKAILLYHVVSGEIMAADIGSGATPMTLEGDTIDVVSSSSGVTVNGAKVISADIDASNGVIHVIDAVILPPDAG